MATTDAEKSPVDDYEHIDRQGDPVADDRDGMTEPASYSAPTAAARTSNNFSFASPAATSSSSNGTNSTAATSSPSAATQAVLKAAGNLGEQAKAKASQAYSTMQEKRGEVESAMTKMYASFVAPMKGAKQPQENAINGMPLFMIELLTWYRPKVTAAVAVGVFLCYFLIACDEYTVVGLFATLAYASLLLAIVLRNLQPFFGKETKSFAILPKGSLQPYATQFVNTLDKLAATTTSLVNCDDFAASVSALIGLYVFSAVANNISGLLLVFIALATAFTVPFVYVMKKNTFDEIVAKIHDLINSTVVKAYDAIPKADFKTD